MKSTKIIVLPLVAMGLLSISPTRTFAESRDLQWSDPIQFHLNLYGWLPEAPAKISVADKTVVDVPEDLDTILDSLNMTAMFEVEAYKGPLVVFANVIYYDGTYDDTSVGPISGQARKWELSEEVWAIKYGFGYRFGSWKLGEAIDSPTMAVYPWIGAFYFHDDYEVEVDPLNMIYDGIEVDGTFDFNTPMVGITPRIKFDERWQMNLSFSYGGWEVDDVDEIYDIIVSLGYRFNMWDISSRVFAGYRYLSIDWEKGVRQLELDAKGPFIGIGWEF